MSVSPPAKVKAFLTSIKEKILDDASVSFEQLYSCNLRLELLQRGVVVEFALDPDSDLARVLDAVRSTAGKPMLNEDSAFPKALLAGSAAVAGRLAEQAARAIIVQNVDPVSSSKEFTTLRDQAHSRCREVNDERLAILLLRPTPEALFIVAEGYYYRAASFQSEVPQTWKKALDCITERSKLSRSDSKEEEEEVIVSWEAIHALSNLIRIAKAKGNAKRVNELSLVLADCYIDSNIATEDDSSRAVSKAFLENLRPGRPSHALKVIDEVKKLLNQQHEVSHDDLYYRVLCLECMLEHEKASIQDLAAINYEKAKNRGGSSSALLSSSLEPFLVDARLTVLKESTQDYEGDLLATASLVRDSIIHTDHSAGHLVCRSYNALTNHITRQNDKAKACKSNAELWPNLASFLEPIIEFFKSASGWIVSSERESRLETIESYLAILSDQGISLIEVALLSTVRCEWMNCGLHPSSRLLANETRVFTSDVLAAVEMRAMKSGEVDKQKGVVKSTISPFDFKIATFQYARISSEMLLILEEHSYDTVGAAEMHRIHERAVSRKDSDVLYSQPSTDFGVPFLEAIVSWSGLHRLPWEHSILTEARAMVRKARTCLAQTQAEWGRPISKSENVLLDLAEADAEGGSFLGGQGAKALDLYQKVVDEAATLDENVLGSLIDIKAISGMADLALRTGNGSERPRELAKEALQRMQSAMDTDHRVPLSFWANPSSTNGAFRFQAASVRQLVARTLIRNGQEREAEFILKEAVQNDPSDAKAAFAFGALLLRNVFFGVDSSPDKAKAAHIQLLKAAKLDATRAAPFALLGYWYEHENDTKRAIGCYSKALLLDPSDPVAGRGVLRLSEPTTLQKIIENALESGASLTGWAWHAAGLQKALIESDDELAVIALLQAMRCRDIDRPEVESLSTFYVYPFSTQTHSRQDLSKVLSDLGSCYFRLGRFTAAIRSYHKSIDVANGNVPSNVLCACANVELKLGLIEEAAYHFREALERPNTTTEIVATYGRGSSLLAMARRDLQDGKAGTAFNHVITALEVCSRCDSSRVSCLNKLIGDLYTFGASLPPDVFGAAGDDFNAFMKAQVEFIAMGENAYGEAEAALPRLPSEEDQQILLASLVSDLGCNVLLQAQILSFWQSRGTFVLQAVESSKEFERAAKVYSRAIEICPTYAPAWCGLGCASVHADPILAQHAFCRSLQLDNLSPDSYSNLSLLYTAHDAFDKSTKVSEALTQVADTPMMWINRALVLERAPSQGDSTQRLQNAANAYQAALQVVRHPSALLGLAITCRVQADGSKAIASLVESDASLREYLGLRGKADIQASVLNSLLTVEIGARLQASKRGDELIKDVSSRLYKELDMLDQSALEYKSLLHSPMIRLKMKEAFVKSENVEQTSNAAEWSLRRQIVHEPDRGDLWLLLAKETASVASHPAAVRQALGAAGKAVSILDQQVTQPLLSASGACNRQIHADQLSDALALRHWLENILSNDGGERSTFDLQKALFLCPSSRISRVALASAMS